jgi:hypothetical protein
VSITARSSIELSVDEQAVVARLMEVMRERGYWLGAFIQCLLKADENASIQKGISIKAAQDVLENFRVVVQNYEWLDENCSVRDPLKDYIRHRLFPDGVDLERLQMRDEIQNGDFHDLVKLWRLEHPEPPKRRQIPAGRLGKRDDDGLDYDDYQ